MSLDLSQFFLSVYKNRLLDIVKKSEIPLSRFKVDENGKIFTISIFETSLKFSVEQRLTNYSELEKGKFGFAYSTITQEFSITETEYSSKDFDIDYVCEFFESWLNHDVERYYRIVEIVNIPNLWEEIQSIQSPSSFNSFTSEDFDKFTPDEKQQVVDSISKFQELLKEEISPVQDDLKIIQEKLNYLSDAVDRLNRFDWKGVALSTVIGIATNMSVDISTGKRIMELFQQSFSSMIRLLPK